MLKPLLWLAGSVRAALGAALSDPWSAGTISQTPQTLLHELLCPWVGAWSFAIQHLCQGDLLVPGFLLRVKGMRCLSLLGTQPGTSFSCPQSAAQEPQRHISSPRSRSSPGSASSLPRPDVSAALSRSSSLYSMCSSPSA